MENKFKSKNEISKIESLLYLAVIILAILSTYATAIGFKSIWNDPRAIGTLISYSFALAVSSFLVYASFTIHYYFQKGKALGLMIAYVLFATISMFFNFNAIYGNSIKTHLIERNLNELKSKLTSIKVKSLEALDNHYKFSFWNKEVDRYGKLAETEANHVLRPGKKHRYQALIDKQTNARIERDAALNRMRPAKEKIEKLVSAAQKKIEYAIESKDEEEQHKACQKGIDVFNEISISVSETVPGFHVDAVSLVDNIENPRFSLITLVELLTSFNNLSKQEITSISLSLLLAFLLDFPIFFAIVILNWPKRKRKYSSTSIFDEEATTSKTGLKRKLKWD